jgi:hypothetical protein
MVRANCGVSGSLAASLAGAAVAIAGSMGFAGCSSSSGGGTTPDGGDDAVSYVMPETGAGDAASSSGGGDASDAATCNIPSGATYGYDAGTGGFSCSPVGPDPSCDSKSYLLRCIASDPYNNPPNATGSLNCGAQMLTSMSIETEFCCACK